MNESKYIGDELSIFKDAINWKRYWYNSVQSYVKGNLLEVGAGIGINTKLILKNPNINNVLAIEPDELLANQIMKNNKVNSSKIRVQIGYLNDLSLSKTFDTIIYTDVLEHIKNDSSELNRAKLHLNKGGHLIIIVPAYNFLFSPFDKAIGHYRRYNKKMLKNSVPNDLTRIELFYLDSLGACASLLNKYILKQSYPSKSQILKWDKLIIPTSKIIDKIIFRSFGKTLIGIWKK